jgi:hypothetical protein
MIHRVDLHEALKKLAVDDEGPGKPVSLHLRCKVVSCNPSRPSVTLEDGRNFEGDLLIGADGVHVSTEHSGHSANCHLTNNVQVNITLSRQWRRYPYLSLWR